MPPKSSRGTRRPKSTTTDRSSGRSDGSTGGSPDSSPNPLGLDQPPPFVPPDEPAAAELGGDDDYDPPAPELVDWTPEKAGNLFRGGAFLLHNADGLAREPEGDELWRATQEDVAAIGPPLARILNRYAPARRLAGVSDEVELGMGFVAYTRRNLALRGRVVKAKRERELTTITPTWGPESDSAAGG